MIVEAFDTAGPLAWPLLVAVVVCVVAIVIPLLAVIVAAWWLRHGTGRTAQAARAFIRDRVGELRPPWAGRGRGAR